MIKHSILTIIVYFKILIAMLIEDFAESLRSLRAKCNAARPISR